MQTWPALRKAAQTPPRAATSSWGATSAQTMKASFAVELYDYGKPLEITLPPADEVVDAATLKTS